MATYEDQFSEHAVHASVSQLQQAVSQKHKHKLDDVALDNLDKLNQALSLIESRLQSASAVLNPAVKLNNINKPLQASFGEVSQFISNGNSSHLTNAGNQIDAAVNAALLLVLVDGANSGYSVHEAVSFKKLADEAIGQIRTDAASSQSAKTDFQAQIQAFEKIVESLKGELQSVKSSAASKIEELESRYEAEKSEREQQFSELETGRKSEFVGQLEKSQHLSGELIAELRGKKEEAERIVQVVGNIGLTGNYKGAGDSEKGAADIFRYIALACFIGTSITVAIVLFLSAKGEFNVFQSFFRLTAALTLLIPGTYAAKESAQHRTSAARHRRAELELASINAYLDDIPEEERHKLKASLTERFFGQPVEEAKSSGNIPSSSLVELLKQSIHALSKK